MPFLFSNALKVSLLVTEPKWGVLLPAATHRKILEAKAGKKGWRFFQMLNDLDEWQTLVSNPSSQGNPEENLVILTKTKTKGSDQSSFSHLKYHSLETAGSC